MKGINKCYDCPNMGTLRTTWKCVCLLLQSREIDEAIFIPNWCPLPDYTPTEQQKINDPYSPHAAWITPQQVYEAQQKQKNAESVDDICIKCKHHGTFDVYCDECTDTNDNYQPKTKEE